MSTLVYRSASTYSAFVYNTVWSVRIAIYNATSAATVRREAMVFKCYRSCSSVVVVVEKVAPASVVARRENLVPLGSVACRRWIEACPELNQHLLHFIHFISSFQQTHVMSTIYLLIRQDFLPSLSVICCANMFLQNKV